MVDDFPAAHSMDTTWYAVDSAGHIGVFETGENGHMPRTASTDQGLILALWDLQEGSEPEEERTEDIARRLGCFFYDYGEDVPVAASLYHRTTVPETPVHVHELPPALRKEWKKVQFAEDFSETRILQPLESFKCTGYGEPLGYLASDGKTVKLVPGKEKEFIEVYREFLRIDPKLLKKFDFPEVVLAAAKKKRAAPKKPRSSPKKSPTKAKKSRAKPKSRGKKKKK
jgi:hypothetical protein